MWPWLMEWRLLLLLGLATVELGFAMMFLSVVWYLFRLEVIKFQLRAAVFSLPTRWKQARSRQQKESGHPCVSLVLVKVVLG